MKIAAPPALNFSDSKTFGFSVPLRDKKPGKNTRKPDAPSPVSVKESCLVEVCSVHARRRERRSRAATLNLLRKEVIHVEPLFLNLLRVSSELKSGDSTLKS